MTYRIHLISFIALLLLTQPIWAQDTRYRVEILVLTHLKHNEEAAETDVIRDYSFATDFLTPEPEEEDTENAEGAGTIDADEPAATGADGAAADPATVDSTALAGDAGAIGPDGLALVEEPEPDPNRLVHIEEMSEVMQDAWRRLRLSAPFRPQQYLSWEQGDQEPFPELRIHDLQVVVRKDPHAVERLETILADLMESESEQQRADAENVFADEAGLAQLQNQAQAGEPQEPAVPGLNQFYRLDGVVKLRRSRFLHLDFDLQLREGLWEPEPLIQVSRQPPVFERANPTLFRVHELQQSRQVRSARMEYFDGPVLSALAYITSISVAEGEQEP